MKTITLTHKYLESFKPVTMPLSVFESLSEEVKSNYTFTEDE